MMTSLGAFLAMLHIVFGTFVPARLADVSANCADRFGVGATTGHGCCSQCTNLGAIHIQLDAVGHHLDVGFVQTGSCAMVTGHGTGVASFNAGVELLMRHGDFPKTGLRRQSEISRSAENTATRLSCALGDIQRARDGRYAA